MHMDNRLVGQYLFHMIVHHFIVESLRKMGYTWTKDLLSYVDNQKIQLNLSYALY